MAGEEVAEETGWRTTVPELLKVEIRLCAQLCNLMYWWKGPDHVDLTDAGGLSAEDSVLKPPVFGIPLFKDKSAVLDCIRTTSVGLGGRIDVRLWEPLQHAAVFVSTSSQVHVAFRGTENLRNALDDLGIWPKALKEEECGMAVRPAGRVHAGFWKHLSRGGAHRRLLACVRDLLTSHRDEEGTPPQVIITGHSLGGASAVLFSSLLLNDDDLADLKVTLITFGEPRSCDTTFAKELSASPRLRHFRVQNELDIVARVPYWTPCPGVYTHTQTWHVWICGGHVHCARQPIRRASMPLSPLLLVRWMWRDNRCGIGRHILSFQGGCMSYTKTEPVNPPRVL